MDFSALHVTHEHEDSLLYDIISGSKSDQLKTGFLIIVAGEKEKGCFFLSYFGVSEA